MSKQYRTPLQIRRDKNTKWPGDTQRVAENGTTFGAWWVHQQDKAEADARWDAFVTHELRAAGLDPFEEHVDFPGTPEVDLLDPNETYWGDPFDPRDFELNDD